jgi:hypothetical protein
MLSCLVGDFFVIDVCCLVGAVLLKEAALLVLVG